MNIATAICISVSLLASAGCLGSAAPAGSESETAQPTAPAVERNDPAPTSTGASPAPRPATWTAANWSGFMTVGAAFEGPDHVEETGGATRPVWSTSFHYEVVDVPEAMEVRLDWDAAVGQIMFMVIVPGNATRGETTVETDVAEHGPLCARLPPEALAVGAYGIMAHSQVAVDAKLAFRVATLGGEGRLVDEPHRIPAAALATYFAAAASGESDGGSLEPQPCEEV